MAMERMMAFGMPPSVGKFRPEQIAQMSTWTVVPESERIASSMTTKHIVPANASTETTVNTLDVGDGMYLDKPGARGTVHRAGIWK